MIRGEYQWDLLGARRKGEHDGWMDLLRKMQDYLAFPEDKRSDCHWSDAIDEALEAARREGREEARATIHAMLLDLIPDKVTEEGLLVLLPVMRWIREISLADGDVITTGIPHDSVGRKLFGQPDPEPEGGE